jgi:hypothetical protein
MIKDYLHAERPHMTLFLVGMLVLVSIGVSVSNPPPAEAHNQTQSPSYFGVQRGVCGFRATNLMHSSVTYRNGQARARLNTRDGGCNAWELKAVDAHAMRIRIDYWDGSQRRTCAQSAWNYRYNTMSSNLNWTDLPRICGFSRRNFTVYAQHAFRVETHDNWVVASTWRGTGKWHWFD